MTGRWSKGAEFPDNPDGVDATVSATLATKSCCGWPPAPPCLRPCWNQNEVLCNCIGDWKIRPHEANLFDMQQK